MSISLPQKVFNDLDVFFSQKTINDVDRNTFQVLNIKDPALKITVSLVFMRDWDSIPSDDYNVVPIKNCGAVFTFPCYWISIPKELCMPYFISILEDFYANVVSTWDLDFGDGNNAGSSGATGNNPNLPCGGQNNNCNCNCK